MRNSETVKIGEREITVNELTVAQIDEVFGVFDVNRKAARAEMLLDSLIPVEVVQAATGLTSEELAGDFTPSELDQIWTAVGKVNSFLSRMLSNLDSAITELSGATTDTPSEDSSAG